MTIGKMIDRRNDNTAAALERHIDSGHFGAVGLVLLPDLFVVGNAESHLTEDDSPRSTASTLFSAQASLQATKWARLSVEVFNIFDAQVDDIAYFYASRLRGEPPVGVPPAGVAPRCGPASRTPCDVHFHPAQPRSLRLGAAFTF